MIGEHYVSSAGPWTVRRLGDCDFDHVKVVDLKSVSTIRNHEPAGLVLKHCLLSNGPSDCACNNESL